MKKFIQSIIAIIIFATTCLSSQAQELNFQNTTYFYRLPNDSLFPSGLTLASFNFSSANPADSLFHDGIYFPANDCFGRNLWIRVRHIAADPNGTSVGINVPQTYSSPCQNGIMIGGWAGFLYDFEIHRDINLTGTRGNYLNALYPTSITVASLEWLSGTCGSFEWINFTIVNSGSTGWSMNSINFSGSNPNSNPAFSDTEAVYTTGGCFPPDGFSYTFPTGSDSISFINGSTNGYTELKMSAGGVSHFQYGYEYSGLSGGYQGMSMAFGTPPTFTVSSQDVTCKNGNDGAINVAISGGIGPFTYEWNNGTTTGNSLTDLATGTYDFTVTDQNGCGTIATTTETISEPLNVTATIDSAHIVNVLCHDDSNGSIEIFGSGSLPVTYEWNTGSTDSLITGLTAGNYFVTISDLNSCIVAYDTVLNMNPIDTSLTLSGHTITTNETGAAFQWINCNGNILILDSTNVSITPNVAGDYKVAIAKNGCSDTSRCVHISFEGIKEINDSGFSVYPNPSNGKFLIELNKSYAAVEISISDIDGRIIFRTNEANKKSIELNSQLRSGIYFIILKTSEGKVVKKLLVE